MTLQEFTDRTGFYPDDALFKAIESRRLFAAKDKEIFCKAYKENKSGLAEAIQREANTAIRRTEQGYTAKLARLTRQLDETQKDLAEAYKEFNKELEWRPYYSYGSDMSQEEYNELEEICTGMDGELKAMSEAEAKELIAEEFGFSPDKIEIVDAVHTYEINRHGELRKASEYKRPPLYGSSDHNYIRFNVRCAATIWHYEMINGELEEYCC